MSIYFDKTLNSETEGNKFQDYLKINKYKLGELKLVRKNIHPKSK